MGTHTSPASCASLETEALRECRNGSCGLSPVDFRDGSRHWKDWLRGGMLRQEHSPRHRPLKAGIQFTEERSSDPAAVP